MLTAQPTCCSSAYHRDTVIGEDCQKTKSLHCLEGTCVMEQKKSLSYRNEWLACIHCCKGDSCSTCRPHTEHSGFNGNSFEPTSARGSASAANLHASCANTLLRMITTAVHKKVQLDGIQGGINILKTSYTNIPNMNMAE
jgi:hypothetical protein